jgi:hypothetical protein
MDKETSSLSHLMSQIRNIGYYAGLTFGIGYCLTLIGLIAVFAEIVERFSGAFSRIPGWYTTALIFYLIGVMCGIYFGLTIIKNSKTAKVSELSTNVISSSVNTFSLMLLFAGIGFTIMAYGLQASLFSPISGVVGAVLLLYGFKTYKSGVSESKLIGAILMLISIILTYLVAYREPGNYMAFIMIQTPVSAGPLFSEPTLEVASLLIAIICGVIFAFPILEKPKTNVANVILPISIILFSCGVMYFNFSAVSAIDQLHHYLIPGWIGYVRVTLNSIWIMFFGFLLLGISGTLILVTACLSMAISIKELSTRAKVPKPELAVPSPGIKYCPKCGASMPADATFCPKCGYRQPKT